jgi:hypothetical protein
MTDEYAAATRACVVQLAEDAEVPLELLDGVTSAEAFADWQVGGKP